MANDTSKIDANRKHSLMGVTDDADKFLKNLQVDPTTGRLKCTAILTADLEDLSDVTITSVADNQILTYDTASSKWINEDPSAGAGDVVGPATNTDLYLPQWDGADSKTLKNGVAIPAGGLAGLTAQGLNDLKVTNQTHTGDVTGSVALTIAADKITEAMLNAENAPTDDYVLTAKASADGGYYWKEAGGGGGTSFWTAIVSPTRTANTTFTCTTTANTSINDILSKGTVMIWEESGVQKVAVIEGVSFGTPTLTVTIKGDVMASIDAGTLKYSLTKATVLKWAVAGSIGATGTDVANVHFADSKYRALAFQIFAGTAGSGTTTIDINDDDTSITSTKSSITTTGTKGTMAASTSTIAYDSKLTIDIDAIADTTAITDLYCQLFVIDNGLLNRS